MNTYRTRLSQTGVCGDKKKKPLKQRGDHCKHCGGQPQRDVLSPHWARDAHNDRLDTHQGQAPWSGVDTLLAQAVSKLKETAKRQLSLALA